MIACRSVCLTYRKRQVLYDVDFTAPSGQITVLLGRNGSGKTSLLRCIAGRRHKCSGTIALDEHLSTGLSPAARAKLLGVMPQTLPSVPVSLIELVRFGRQPYLGFQSKLSDRDHDIVRRALEETELWPLRQEAVCDLSGGQRQLAYFAMLLAQNTPNVLLDEPTSNLDAEYKQRVYTLLRRMRAQGRTVVLTLHALQDAVELADNICVLEQGRTCFFGSAQEFVQSDIPLRIFALEPVCVNTPKTGPFTVFHLPMQ